MPFFAPAFTETTQPALVILGTADRFYNEKILGEMRSGRAFEMMQIEGGDHSLNIGDDLKATLQVLGEVVRKILEFADA
jgi:predicted alpha/beta-hydrolase family hydrolase